MTNNIQNTQIELIEKKFNVTSLLLSLVLIGLGCFLFIYSGNIESNMIQFTAIYTISGQLLQTIEGGQRDAAHLPNGMYILQHRMSDGSIKSEKVTNYN